MGDLLEQLPVYLFTALWLLQVLDGRSGLSGPVAPGSSSGFPNVARTPPLPLGLAGGFLTAGWPGRPVVDSPVWLPHAPASHHDVGPAGAGAFCLSVFTAGDGKLLPG